MKKLTLLPVFLLVAATSAGAHCQIPCGIFGDQREFDTLREDIATIEKSMAKIEELAVQGAPQANQIVRWVNNKEYHAKKIQQTVLDYFLAQRVKKPGPDADGKAREKYANQLSLLHGLIVHAMKAKQTTDVKHTALLRDYLEDFEKLYYGKEEKKHLHDHHGHHGHDHD